MYDCPNCGANIKFDIKLQKMLCSFCDSTFDPKKVVEKHQVEEHETEEASLNDRVIKVKIYTCSQCGGEIVGDETEAATFCSFCGASTIMNSRMEKTRKPDKILPFKISKDDCARAYKSIVNKAIFAPKYVKDPQRIDSFRGIYMPYWLYDMEKKGDVNYSATHSYQKGDYEYTEHYNISTNVEAVYDGINYDASSGFSDKLSNSIAPFYMKGSEEFTTAYMSGFYADVMDVRGDVYKREASDAARKDASDRLVAATPKGRYSVDAKSALAVMNMHVTDEKLAMLPVWFMSYRTKDDNGEERVLYSVINGQTGKASVDLPVDMKKYLCGSVLLAIPLFLLFEMFFTFRPVTVLIIAAIIMIICGIVISMVSYSAARQDLKIDDRGYMSKIGRLRMKSESEAQKKQNAEVQELDSKYKKEIQKGNRPLFYICILLVIALWIIKPVNDAYYYLGAILCGICDCWMLVAVMKSYNKRISRPLPQFKRKGGDDSANISKDI